MAIKSKNKLCDYFNPEFIQVAFVKAHCDNRFTHLFTFYY